MLGPGIAATKRGAVALVNQLAPEDLVGILAFDTQPYVVAEVQQAGQVGRSLVEKLVKLRSSGGTDIYPALAAAANRLELTGATVKHIILLSDGNTPFQRQAYHALVESFRLNGGTISTIGTRAAFIHPPPPPPEARPGDPPRRPARVGIGLKRYPAPRPTRPARQQRLM